MICNISTTDFANIQKEKKGEMNMLKWLNNKKKDNKGFSLVELIIVVAIMAILVGLLAPQYIKYVEKSRKSSDATNLSEMVNAVQVYAADSDNNLPVGTYKIIITDSGVQLGDNDAQKDTLGPIIAATAPDYATIKLKSNKWKNSTADDATTEETIYAEIEVDNNGGTQVTYWPLEVSTLIKGSTN